MAESTLDPLEQAALSGKLFGAADDEAPRSSPRSRESSCSSLDSDDDDAAANSDDELAFTLPDSTVSGNSAARRTMGKRGVSSNTGVKGVLADYREQQRSRNKIQASVDNDEEQALASYRRQRLQELQQMGSHERAPGSTATYGHLREIDQSGFVRAISESQSMPNTTVVIHIYESSIPLCALVNSHFITLAKRYSTSVQFLRARSSALEFAQGFERDVLPTLLVYRGGENVQNIVALEREFKQALGQSVEDGDDLDYEELDEDQVTVQLVESLLVSHNVLDKRQAVLARTTPAHPSSGSDSE